MFLLLLLFLTAYEARVSKHVIFLLFFRSQVGKRVDDDAEDEIENDDDEDEEEQQIINNAPDEQDAFLWCKKKGWKFAGFTTCATWRQITKLKLTDDKLVGQPVEHVSDKCCNLYNHATVLELKQIKKIIKPAKITWDNSIDARMHLTTSKLDKHLI